MHLYRNAWVYYKCYRILKLSLFHVLVSKVNLKVRGDAKIIKNLPDFRSQRLRILGADGYHKLHVDLPSPADFSFGIIFVPGGSTLLWGSSR